MDLLAETQAKQRQERDRSRGPLPEIVRGSGKDRSVQIGIAGTVLIHVLLLLLGPRLLRFEHGSLPPAGERSQEFNIELEDPLLEQLAGQAPPPDPFNFVEVNPDAPDNEPDSTVNFGAQNQQSAQPEESEDMSGDRPFLEGQTEIQTSQIVSGELTEQPPPLPPEPSPPPPVEENEETAEEQADSARREEIPLSGFEKLPSDGSDGYGSNVAEVPEGSAEFDEYVEGVKDAPALTGPLGRLRIDPTRPLPRPRLEPQKVRARPAIFTENLAGTANIGPTGIDARWSNYGQYLQQLIETVQIQWDRILLQSRVYPGSNTQVSVKFAINDRGEIARIVSVEGSAGELGKQSCVSAITSRAPYGEWTDDMKRILGEEQEMTFTFYYR
ncbi:hypothetical protein AXK11_04705 [Cephaloticoccus primus]|uniref:TonB C-terminal domain-containing protein n=1 Tax=Cephaloticoccus primus TaxID=1548207 RepID=A0A139SN52_9BACT|nr:hypothetical protein [Cephaloticoccus primus]KXU35985.1 hypothetical protein AXK11_04705 [Cephaloticoccus primus]